MLDDADVFASPFLAFLLRDCDGDVGTSSERNVGSCATLTYVVINVNIEISLNEYLQYLTSLYQIACTCQHKKEWQATSAPPPPLNSVENMLPLPCFADVCTLFCSLCDAIGAIS